MSNTVLETLGLTNVFADVNQRLIDVSTEELLARNPDVLVLTFGGSETNIKNGADALVGGPLAVDGLESIAQGLAGLK